MAQLNNMNKAKLELVRRDWDVSIAVEYISCIASI